MFQPALRPDIQSTDSSDKILPTHNKIKTENLNYELNFKGKKTLSNNLSAEIKLIKNRKCICHLSRDLLEEACY